MSKFKVGDKVRVVKGRDRFNKVFYGDNEIFIVSRINTLCSNIIYGEDDRMVDASYDMLELVEEKSFTQQDLEVGMWYQYENGDMGSILNEVQLENTKRAYIKYAYKRNENGDLIKIWERPKEKLYSVSLPKGYNVDKDGNIYKYQTIANKYLFNEKEIKELEILKEIIE